MKNGKVWGETKLVFRNYNSEVHRIDIKPGGYCSKHKHIYKHNIFFVESGSILIEVWKNDYNLKDVTLLRKGESIDVGPGEFHRFYTGKGATVYEIYYAEPIGNDIVRKDHGGVKR